MELISIGWGSQAHTRLGLALIHEIMCKLREDFAKDRVFLSYGNTRLVHYNDHFLNGGILIDLSEIADQADFVANHIFNYNSVEPDILLFHKNKYIKNETGAYLAGLPDLVVEIWSQMNQPYERTAKQELYASSPITEHWYIEEDSDLVERWLGKKRLPDATTRKKLTTQNGLELDISDFAV